MPAVLLAAEWWIAEEWLPELLGSGQMRPWARVTVKEAIKSHLHSMRASTSLLGLVPLSEQSPTTGRIYRAETLNSSFFLFPSDGVEETRVDERGQESPANCLTESGSLSYL